MTAIAAIDALAPVERGRYEDALVVVQARPVGSTGGLTVGMSADGRFAVDHDVDHRLDDGVAERLAAALAPLTDDHEVFARVFTGIVVTSGSDPIAAWENFYRNSIAGIIDHGRAGYSGIYRHAVGLLPGTSVLDLGCGFGFLALHLAATGTEVVACDVDQGTVRLLRRMVDRLCSRVSVLDTGTGRVPLPSSSVDAVVMLHVLEHVDHEEGAALIAEATRVARRRVVVAVPYEDQATSLYGHVRRLFPSDLRDFGAASGWSYDVHEHLGGWLVLDRTSPGHRDHPPGRSQPSEGELQ